MKPQKIWLILISIVFILFGFSLIFNHPPKSNQATYTNNNIPTPKTSTPKKYLIKTDFIPQAPDKNWDEPWQDACEEASLLTVNYFYQNSHPSMDQIRNDIQKMISYETSQGFDISINTTQMSQLVEKYLDYPTKIISYPSIEDIKKYISQNIPVIVPAAGKVLYQENKFFSHGGPDYHNLVILGFDDNSQKFIVHDVGTQHGAYFEYSYKILMESIHDFPESKNKLDILQGTPKILVLLK